MIHRTSLVFIEPRKDPDLPAMVAELDGDESDYLLRHVETLQARADDPEAQRTRFQPGSDVPALLRKLIKAGETEFVEIVNTLATRLSASTNAATRPSPGIFAVITSGRTASRASGVVLLKLDATHEAAQFKRLARAKVKLSILKNLLPSPGDLQKGITWPDPRDGSDAVIRDRNIENALYFLNAFQLQAAPKATQTERTVLEAITRLPPDEVPRAYVAAAAKHGSADTVMAELRQEFPELDVDRAPFGAAGAVPGSVRPNKLAARGLKVVADGFEIRVPANRTERISWDREGDGWLIEIHVDTEPTWEPV